MAKPDFAAEERLMQHLDRESARTTKVVRQMIYETGRPDLVAEFDQNMKDVASGVARARNIWHSISPAQKRVLARMGDGGNKLQRFERGMYDVVNHLGSLETGIRLATVRSLAARSLLDWNGGAFDPEALAVLSEQGRFVLAHGRPAAPPSKE